MPPRDATVQSESRGRLPRGTLSQDLIIEAAFRIADSSGMQNLTFQALGRELSAHPTAIYRHFRNKDELLLALIDALHEEALASSPPPTDDWARDLLEIALNTHAAFLRHPHVGALAAARTARRENEFRYVERNLDCMRRAGLSDADAARYYRVFTDLVLCYSSMNASRAALRPEILAADLRAWQTDYLSLPSDRYPNIAKVSSKFVAVDDPKNFVLAVQALIDTIRVKVLSRQSSRRSNRP